MSTFPIDRVVRALDRAGLLVATSGALPHAARDISDDSRSVAPGTLFIAVRGSARDGHAFLPAAASAGAGAAIVEEAGATSLPVIVVRDGRRAAALAAAVAFDEPARSLTLVGVTGTNGKTTTVHILRHLLDAESAPSASIGTLGVLVGSAGDAIPGGAGLTTPGPVELQRVLRTLVDAGVRVVAMEVSSHSLHQQRVEGLAFDVAVFTNLTLDHLDYHGSMGAYFEAKALLLRQLEAGGTAVINADDRAWDALPPTARRLTFGLEASDETDVRALDLTYTPQGSDWLLRLVDRARAPTAAPVHLPLLGDFNVINALGAAAAAHALGRPTSEIAARLATVPQVPGRLELIAEHPAVLRDYAHTPDALERALNAVRPFATRALTVVFGCGGDRDRGKRPRMGAIAERLADHAIVTSDNPRTEDPERILDEIEAGMHGSNHERIEDRREAIARALDRASDRGDVILLAGKGHETYQIRGETKLPFDEKEIVRELTGSPK